MIVKARVVFEFDFLSGIHEGTIDKLKEDLEGLLGTVDYMTNGTKHPPFLIYVSAIELPGMTFGRPYGETIDEYD